MLAEAAKQTNNVDRLRRLAVHMLAHELERKHVQALFDSPDDDRIGIADAQHALAVAAFGVVNARQKTGSPVRRNLLRPGDERPNALDTQLALGPDRVQKAPVAVRRLEHEVFRLDVALFKKELRSQ